MITALGYAGPAPRILSAIHSIRPIKDMYTQPTLRTLLLTLALALLGPACLPEPASAQYFGRNKVQYDDFDFRILTTPHFEIYYYEEEEEAVRDAARMAERWYERHQETFLYTLDERKPLIFYANDADFQQTNVIEGFIGEGTGGVTESLQERVIMPLTGSYASTNHVLGHELVHSYQYDYGLSPPDSIRFDLSALPLWLIEGTAEYLSVGRVDPHTAMWLRDAALRDDLPTMEQLTTNPFEYFPYRFGQAYMAYIGGKYGDTAVTNLFRLGGRMPLDSAAVRLFNITSDSLSNEWIEAVRTAYLPLMEGRTPPEEAGRSVLAGDETYLAPSLSPDGRYVAFLSDRDLFSINLFVADSRSGEVVAKLQSAGATPHFDAIRFIESAGSWSPDGQRFAFVTFAQGDNEIAVFDVASEDVVRRIRVDGVGALKNPAWSPDGNRIAFSGMDGGISDLYVLDLTTETVRQLTSDRYADLQPAWSPDGETLAFVTDRGPGGTNFQTLDFAPMRLGLLRVSDGTVRTLVPFEQGLHINPQFAPDGRSLYFLSDQDGFKDIYRYDLRDREIHRVTRLKTGVSGIAELSPALSVASQSGILMFSVFSDKTYAVYALDPDSARGTPARPVRNRPAASLPPVQRQIAGLVGAYLSDPLTGLPDSPDYDVRDYGAKLRLTAIAPPTLGVSVGGPFGGGINGGVGFYFSDMLGNLNLTAAVQAQGTLRDIGGQVSFINRKRRFNYGASAGHIPFRYGISYVDVAEDPESGVSTRRINQEIRRIYIDQVNLLGTLPLSTTRRFDFSVGATRYGFDYERLSYYIYSGGVRQDREDLAAPDPIYLAQASVAYVRDYSFFGFTSPVRGGRYRAEVTPYVGTASFVRLLLDYRRYLFARPVTVAFRGLHIGNYGAGEDDPFSQEYLGSTYYPGYVRGYNFSSFDFDECTTTDIDHCAVTARLTGTRIATASAEIRLPLIGNDQFGLLNFRFLPVELAAFFDAGLAWTEDEAPRLELKRESTERIPVFSTGLTTRYNLFGSLILEIFYAYPFQRPEANGVWGFSLLPGW